ncbi:hypothetical protein VP01_2946g1 [Puccinia sorghi]|uniref:Uncharacterized protein n=1 Tax=Puccinia sorghi TaxID=27349 RepID=A0A0L6V2S0_9BASI|nr:hypothetical protein VP01_2946g1 [Puccinia sorghi]
MILSSSCNQRLLCVTMLPQYLCNNCKKNMLNCLQLTCRNTQEDSVVCTVTVPKHLHMQKYVLSRFFSQCVQPCMRLLILLFTLCLSPSSWDYYPLLPLLHHYNTYQQTSPPPYPVHCMYYKLPPLVMKNQTRAKEELEKDEIMRNEGLRVAASSSDAETDWEVVEEYSVDEKGGDGVKEIILNGKEISHDRADRIQLICCVAHPSEEENLNHLLFFNYSIEHTDPLINCQGGLTEESQRTSSGGTAGLPFLISMFFHIDHVKLLAHLYSFVQAFFVLILSPKKTLFVVYFFLCCGQVQIIRSLFTTISFSLIAAIIYKSQKLTGHWRRVGWTRVLLESAAGGKTGFSCAANRGSGFEHSRVWNCRRMRVAWGGVERSAKIFRISFQVSAAKSGDRECLLTESRSLSLLLCPVFHSKTKDYLKTTEKNSQLTVCLFTMATPMTLATSGCNLWVSLIWKICNLAQNIGKINCGTYRILPILYGLSCRNSGSFCCYSNISPTVSQPRFDAQSPCILHSDCSKTSKYANRWSLDDSLTGTCWISTAGS